MDTQNSVVKSALLDLFNKGKCETEAHEVISKTHSCYSVSLNTVNKWFEIFRLEKQSLGDKKKRGRNFKFTDEYLIDLINKNPGLNTFELGKLANTSHATISNRLNQINSNRPSNNKLVLYTDHSKSKRKSKKVTDEYLISLINENPGLNMKELAKLSDTSIGVISYRIKKININEERIKYCKKGFQNGKTKFTDEFLINLINENPGINMTKLAILTDTSQATISNRLKRINNDRSNDDKIILMKNRSKTRKKPKKITDEFLIQLINENPGINITKLANLAGTYDSYISLRLNQINIDQEKVIYSKKSFKNGATKFTDEFLINLINENPEMSTYELAKIANTSPSTITNRLNQINSDREKVKYIKKGKRSGAVNLTDEFLINLVNENPGLNMKELANLANTSQTTISNRLKKINSDGEKVNYIKMGSHKFLKFTDEFLINLINENPSLSVAELAKLANSSISTIYRRLRQINSNGERVKYAYKNR